MSTCNIIMLTCTLSIFIEIIFFYCFFLLTPLSDILHATCNINMLTCDLFMSTCNIHVIMSTCDISMSTCNIIMCTCDLFMSTCNMRLVDVIYPACWRQKYATLVNRVIHVKIVFRNANIWPILTHFEKKYLFSKRFDLVPNLTPFLKVRNFSKCVVTDQF
mgnify:CR=1 FL=1